MNKLTFRTLALFHCFLLLLAVSSFVRAADDRRSDVDDFLFEDSVGLEGDDDAIPRREAQYAEEIDKIQIFVHGNWQDVSNVTLLFGTQYKFRAVPKPNGSTWTSDINWGWNSTTATGEETEWTFNRFVNANSTTHDDSIMTVRYRNDTKRVNIKLVKPEVTKISWKNSISLYKDDAIGTTPIINPVWTKTVGVPAPSKSDPGAYVKGSTARVELEIEATNPLSYLVNADVQGVKEHPKQSEFRVQKCQF